MISKRLFIILISFALIVSSCNLPSSKPAQQTDPNAVFTAAAQTVVVQLTQNALLNPATVAPPSVEPPTAPAAATPIPLPIITDTPFVITATTAPVIPTVGCEAAQFISDITIPDGTTIAADDNFTKTWRLKNIGSCTWNSSYSLVYDSGDHMGGPSSQPLASDVAPGGMIDIPINLQAPSSDGTYIGFYGLSNGSGIRLPIAGGFSGRSFSVNIKVGSGSSGGGIFAVTSVGFTVDHPASCAATLFKYTVTAKIKANKAGVVDYTWIRSDGASGPGDSGSVNFTGPGTKEVTTEWYTTATVWLDLNIDSPNHQRFGRANMSCP
ncbi:MAG: NBR1-Ig-like domain-containing protein [Chloroflexota bacterium]